MDFTGPIKWVKKWTWSKGIPAAIQGFCTWFCFSSVWAWSTSYWCRIPSMISWTMSIKRLWGKDCMKFLVLGFLYFLWIEITGISLPCPFRFLTGYLCPGCGITTLCLSLFCGDFPSAREANPFLFYTLPLFLGCYLLTKTTHCELLISCITHLVYPLYLVTLILYGFYRNGIFF